MNARYVLDKLAIQRSLELLAEAVTTPSGWFTCPECSARMDKEAALLRCLICGSVLEEGE